MEVHFRAKKTLSNAEHGALQRAVRDLAESRLWWCGAPVAFVNNQRRLECWLAVSFDPRDPEDVAKGEDDLKIVRDFLDTHDLEWEVSRHETSMQGIPWGVGSRGLAMRIAHTASVRASVEIERTAESEALAGDIALQRDQGSVKLGRFRFAADGDEPRRDALDRAALALDLEVLGPSWTVITKERAWFLFEALLRADLAYRSPLLDATTARAFAARFFDGFDSASTYVTNGTWDDALRGGSNPIGDATFDVAVGVASDTDVALVWIGDED